MIRVLKEMKLLHVLGVSFAGLIVVTASIFLPRARMVREQKKLIPLLKKTKS